MHGAVLSEFPVSQKVWSCVKSPDASVIELLSAQTGISKVLAGLLAARGLERPEDAIAFLNPGHSQLHDPFLMDGMHAAVERIQRAGKTGEQVLIYGDYDVDGTTSVALMMKGLKGFLQDRLSFYIPDRYKEGYGISEAGVHFASSTGCKLIIALDCGIRSADKVELAKTLGIDFIICDHHLPGDTIPDAYAVLDPKKPDCAYPYKELSGAAIGFKLLQALYQSEVIAEDPAAFIDLVALSVSADIVEMKGENRVLAHLGLQLINSGKSPVMTKMLYGAEKEPGTSGSKPAGVSDLVFKAAPLINAAGRIKHAGEAVRFLLSESDLEMNELYSNLQLLNRERVNLDKQMTDEALLMIRGSSALRTASSTVLFHPQWHKGVVGIVASRVMEKYYRPTIILTESGGKITGSARSVRGFDIHAAIASCESLLLQYGGHQAAAGLTMLPENLEAFASRFEQIVSETLKPISKTEELQVDLVIDLADIDLNLYNEVNKLAPFGPGNMTPVFLTRGLTDNGWAKIVGNSHLKMKLGKPGLPYIDAIAFGQAHHCEAITAGIPVDVCYTLDENHWNGRVSLQLMVKDLKH